MSAEDVKDLFHDWPICKSCGYPANSSDYNRHFSMHTRGPNVYYKCRCGQFNEYHPNFNHGETMDGHCLSPLILSKLENEYIEWFSLHDNLNGIHIITWPDSWVRFASIFSYKLVIGQFSAVSKSLNTSGNIYSIFHFSPRSPNIDEDTLNGHSTSVKERNIQPFKSFITPPSSSFGYLHICDPGIGRPCPINKNMLFTKHRGGILQSMKNQINYVKDYGELHKNKLFYIITNEKFYLTEQTPYNLSSVLEYPQLKPLFLIDDVNVYCQSGRIGDFTSFLATCKNNNVPTICFSPRSKMRGNLGELITMMDTENINYSFHTIDTEERVNYLVQNNFLNSLTKEQLSSPYSTYSEVASEHKHN